MSLFWSVIATLVLIGFALLLVFWLTYEFCELFAIIMAMIGIFLIVPSFFMSLFYCIGQLIIAIWTKLKEELE